MRNLLKKLSMIKYCEKIIEEKYPDDVFEEYSEDGFPSSPEWYCIIAKK